MTPRFTLDGSGQLEQRLAGLCRLAGRKIAAILPPGQLDALLLGGGYGRGEGGVLRDAQQEEPYNDLEFYLFLRGHPFLNERRFGPAIHALAAQLTAQAGIDIEFKIASISKFARQPVTMFSYDLVCGHRCILGDDSFLEACAHHRLARRIPLHEATRLLLNRCSGLLFATQKLRAPQWTADDHDFVGRNLAKAELAFGDVVLAALGEYHFSCLERQKRLQKIDPTARLPWLDQVIEHHRAGCEFKLYPTRSRAERSQLEQLLGQLNNLAEQIWLWLENRRLNQNFTSTFDYATSPIRKTPEHRPFRNFIVTAARLGPTALLNPLAARYPRERLLIALPLLLWHESALANPEPRALLERALLTNEQSWSGRVEAYRRIWNLFN